MRQPMVLELCWPLLLAAPMSAQTHQTASAIALPQIPAIGRRYFGSGTARVTVTGSITFDAELAVDTVASFGDGEKTWIQFGTSGSAEPNALLVFGDGDVGIGIAQGKKSATGEAALCSGEAEATAATVAGRYLCPGITSYDPATGRMGKVDITIRFVARSK